MLVQVQTSIVPRRTLGTFAEYTRYQVIETMHLVTACTHRVVTAASWQTCSTH